MVRVDMGPPRFAPADIPLDIPGDAAPPLRLALIREGATWVLPAFAVGMGNPHCVVLLESAGEPRLDGVDASRIAEAAREALPFPAGVNVEVVEIVSPLRVRQRTVERGVGETDACGTGACATVAALRRAGRIAGEGQVNVELRGGSLLVDWPGHGPVLMTGPAMAVFDGHVAVPDSLPTASSRRG
jgi:diaminopimelate epimerase